MSVADQAPTPIGLSNLPIGATRGLSDRAEVLATFFQGLTDPNRMRILELLAERPRTVTELVSELGIAQGRVSSHVACLRWCDYVQAEVEGRLNRYRLVDERVRKILTLGEAVVRDNVDRLTSCRARDRRRSVRRTDPVVTGSLVAIVCCIAFPLLIPSGVALVLIATGVSIPVVGLAVGAVWLWRARRRRERRSPHSDRIDAG